MYSKPTPRPGSLFAGNILFALGLGVILFLAMAAYQQFASGWLEAGQPAVSAPTAELPPVWLPPVTSTPQPTPTPLPPTPTPAPQVPVRLAIPAIGVNAAVVETGLEVVQWLNSPALRWQTPDYAVGHRQTSARPGQPGNMILSGHNNTAGSVFLRLSELKPGDEFTVYTADFSYNYRVVASEKVLWTGAGERQIARHYELTADTPDETLTLVSCWPYATYTHRLYVTAKPVPR